MSNNASVDTIRPFAGDMIDDFYEEGMLLDVSEDGEVTLVWTEGLEFHSRYVSEYWESLTDSDGYLSQSTTREVVAHLQNNLPSSNATVMHDPSEEWDDEPSLGIAVRIEVPEGLDTPIDYVHELAYPVIATLLNMADPGTLQSPYLFDTAIKGLCGPR